MKKWLSVLACAALMLSVTPMGIMAAAEGTDMLIDQDGEYTVSSCNSLVVDGAKANIVLKDAVIGDNGGSAVTLKGNAAVVLNLEGNSTITGNASNASCGILVEDGSSLVIEGDGALTVTGGKYGAGIGTYGTGTNVAPAERVKCGDITINGGTIYAHGGNCGAGIGSGYHLDAGNITINGGTVYAYGNGCGAGIGSGYGTSGGAANVAAVGDYNGGNIKITGGTVYAAAFEMDFSTFDYMDASTYAGPNTFAAGIGGGYGASSGFVSITGGKVTAVGSCGGAGIGSGRGTSKAKNYNKDSFMVNVAIGGTAEIVAVATDDTRNYQGGGAGIGSGRGTHTGGTITIDGSAKVTAVGSPFASAIGSGSNVSPVDGSTPKSEFIRIDSGVTLYAVASGHNAVDYAEQQSVAATIGSNNAVEGTQVTLGDKIYTVPGNTTSLWANQAQSITVSVVTPKRMSIRLQDGTILKNGDSFRMVPGTEVNFQMCSNNWDNDTYDDNGNGVAGTVVYHVNISDSYNGRSYDADSHTFTLPKGDLTLRTDVNRCFMAYRYHFTSGNYNKQTGIAQVVNKPLESLSVNLPLGSKITSDAYKAMNKIGSEDVFIELGNDATQSYTDYNWAF